MDMMFSFDEEKQQSTGDDDSGYSSTGADDQTLTQATDEEDSKLHNKIGKTEDAVVWKLKFAVFSVVIIAMIVTALSVFFYTSRSEQSQFEEQFFEYGNKVFESVGEKFDETFGAMDSLGADIVAYTNSTGQTWPLIKVPFFGIRAAKVLSIISTVNVALCPIVTNETRLAWEDFSSLHGSEWVDEFMKLQRTDPHYYGPTDIDAYNVTDVIHGDFGPIPYDTIDRVFLPTWYTYPVIPRYDPYNWDYLSVSSPETIDDMLSHKVVTISEPYHLPDPDDPVEVAENKAWADWFSDYIPPDEDPTEPPVDISFPLYDSLETVRPDLEDGKLVGMLTATIYMRDIFENILPPGSSGVVLVVENGCSPTFSYIVTSEAKYLGRGDHHEIRFGELGLKRTDAEIVSLMSASTYVGPSVYTGSCPFTFHIYPSTALEAEYVTNKPLIFTVGAISIFVVCVLIFIIYDRSVERRQNVVLCSATKSNAVVASLFPAEVRGRLFNENDETEGDPKNNILDSGGSNTIGPSSSGFEGNPIAQLYPAVTVLFADIAGFTSWSSSHPPSQVFHLLESLYAIFDKIAKERHVFKVETIGDCYVAVCGLPKPRKHHAPVMCRFAEDCREKSALLFQELESTLGGTANLSIRFGLNSGPTVAGILRGEKSRFQIFGDTVNTAARMESNGQPGRILASQTTTDLLIEAGKAHWLSKRDQLVEAKGKGSLQTYWVEPSNSSTKDLPLCDSDDDQLQELKHDKTTSEMVDWYIRSMEAILSNTPLPGDRQCNDVMPHLPSRQPRDEVSDDIHILSSQRTSILPLSLKVKKQLREYVSTIAFMYNCHTFHNFPHAVHVGMSAKRYLDKTKDTKLASEPLVQFSVLFATLIHDLDHPGCSNAQLVKCGSQISSLYGGKSVAEQNSIDIAWDLLNTEEFRDLRCRLDMPVLRQLVVNLVIATDIFDPELKLWRQSRDLSENSTLFLEKMIQAADVSHCMQPWYVFLKWNKSLFEEMMIAFKDGRHNCDPSAGWYVGELGFFDNYIIPTAIDLENCGILGANDVMWARNNRREWEAKGEQLVRAWVNEN